ncbi:hypothetical protein CB0940_11009 [Cercospora beticola]|uniref:Uncharacterized protein n=1 Tax=Cercospora beticola TaxID=122368 RepID=A0A2G5HE11_CERBT|nr:hypothetical protein CB0940_11009 [Cercospora beticola]PIA90472.1 hypothetical protein CB0940_11009 [Cercospora beticola]WPB07834.1 hypothetical protein RHO25_012498 [Cercospora beticola]CAK1368330.1 unnamed protein product [Cercospora beticola]
MEQIVEQGSGVAATAASPAVHGSKAGSVVSISDTGGQGDQNGSTASGGKELEASQAKPAAENDPRTQEDKQRGTKRPGEGEAGSAVAKKSRVNEAASGGAAAKDTKGNVKQPETLEEFKAKGNEIISRKNAQIAELKAQLAEAREENESLEASREAERAARIALEQKQLAREANKKVKAARQKELQDEIAKEIRFELQQAYETKLKNKNASFEKRVSSKYATAEKNLSRKLHDKSEKLEATLEELRDLKEDYKEEVRELKAEAKENAKQGNPKAQQKFKDCQEDLKAKQKELDREKAIVENLKKQLIHSKAETNAEETQRRDLDKTYIGVCNEKRKLEAEIQQLQQKSTLQEQDAKNDKRRYKQIMQQMQESCKKKIDEADKKWKIQADNSAENQERVVDAQRLIFQLNNANDRLLRHVGEHQKKIQDLEAEKRKKDSEVQKFREKLVELGISPLAVLGSNSAAVSSHGAASIALNRDSEGKATGADMGKNAE